MFFWGEIKAEIALTLGQSENPVEAAKKFMETYEGPALEPEEVERRENRGTHLKLFEQTFAQAGWRGMNELISRSAQKNQKGGSKITVRPTRTINQ